MCSVHLEYEGEFLGSFHNLKMEVKTTTKKTFIHVTNSNSLKTSSLGMFLIPNRPDQPHHCQE